MWSGSAAADGHVIAPSAAHQCHVIAASARLAYPPGLSIDHRAARAAGRPANARRARSRQGFRVSGYFKGLRV